MMYGPDGPEMKDFNDALDSVNASAQGSAGFVWMAQSESENPEDDLIFNEPAWLVNLTVWKSVNELLAFVRSDQHLAIMKRRHEWFESSPEATMVLWWIPRGHIPSVAEAQHKLEALRSRGPTPDAFSFAIPFPRPGESIP